MAIRPGNALLHQRKAPKIPRSPEISYVRSQIAPRAPSGQTNVERIFGYLDLGCRRCAPLRSKHLNGFREVEHKADANKKWIVLRVCHSTVVSILGRALCPDFCIRHFFGGQQEGF